MPCRAWKCVPTVIFSGVDISEVLGCHLLQQMSSHWGSQKFLQVFVSQFTSYFSVFNSFLTQWIMAILSKGYKPDYFESPNFLKLNYEYARPSFKICWIWIFPWVKLSWNSSSVWEKFWWLNSFWQFLCEGLSSFNPKLICMALKFIWKKHFLFYRT